MKKLLKIFVSILCIIPAVSASAQTFGVQGGLNLASQAWEFGGDKVTEDKKTALGISLGGTVEFDIKENIAFQTGLIFNQKGVVFKGVYGLNDTKYKQVWRLNYLDIPLNLKYKIGLSNFDVYGAIGPYLGFAISGKYKWEDGDHDGDEAMDIGNNEQDDDFKPLDFGLNFAAGIEVGVIGIGMQYSLGIPNLEPGGDEDNYTKNRVFSLFVSYKFGK